MIFRSFSIVSFSFNTVTLGQWVPRPVSYLPDWVLAARATWAEWTMGPSNVVTESNLREYNSLPRFDLFLYEQENV